MTQSSTRLLWTLSIGLGVFLLWASLFQLDKVTRGSGRIIPSVQNQTVQHLEGGIISEILVREGQRIKRGDILMRIDNRFTAAELSNTQTDLVSKQLTFARLEAEARGDSTLELDPKIVESAPEAAANERELFQSRRRQIQQELGTVDDQIRGFRLQLQSLEERQTNLGSERTLQERQLSSLEKALVVDAVSENEVLDKRSSVMQLRTRIADVANQIPQVRSQLAEAQSRRQEAWLRYQTEAKEAATELRMQITKSKKALTAFKDREAREDIRAPIDGVINTIFLQTEGGVVRGGDKLVEIVPIDETVIIEAQVEPKDRGKIWPGLPATVKVSAYDFAIHGGLSGEVVDISADALQNPEGRSYYRVRLRADTGRFGPDRPVVPGMTVDVDIISGQQTILNYLMSPVNSVRHNAFRE